VTRRGILFQELYYTCKLASDEQWFVQAKERGRWQIPVAYDPRKTDVLYLRLDGGRRLERCELLPREGAFHSRDWYEALDYLTRRKVDEELAKTQEQQAQARRHAHQTQIIDQAMEKTRAAVTGRSKRSRLQGIRENRQAEREEERQTGAWDLGKADRSDGPLTEERKVPDEDQEYVSFPQDLDHLRKVREERLNDER